MPFKNLAQPKHLTTLDAEIRDSAQLDPHNYFAVVTTDPVHLSIHQLAANTAGSKTNISLPAADEVAFIKRNTIVVRSGDELWAVLDIQHGAKIDQVGRDIRWLRGCPNGETALAVGWDGQGAALSLRQYEVGGRQFTVRGDLRAMDVGHKETYVVADGKGGGQFRIHPGLTPEAGASARADLPEDAKGYDRLEGGPELSALFKRGGDRMCVISRDGAGNVAAKMVVLDTAVVDATVISTSLFTIGLDGNIRLFNGNTLHQADDAPMTPLATINTPARAEPTLLDSTYKGGAKLWVGSKAGDVIRVITSKAGLGDIGG